MSEEETNLKVTLEFKNKKDYEIFMEELVKEALVEGTLKEKAPNQFIVLKFTNDEI